MSRIQNFVSVARKYFLFVAPHCTAPQSCYQKLTPHRAAPQIIYLIKKLECMYGFRGIALELMKSYFNNRYQYTKIAESKSTLRKIKCGVPQGSSLGPLLFILYIKDLPLASEYSTTLFAVDTYLLLNPIT